MGIALSKAPFNLSQEKITSVVWQLDQMTVEGKISQLAVPARSLQQSEQKGTKIVRTFPGKDSKDRDHSTDVRWPVNRMSREEWDTRFGKEYRAEIEKGAAFFIIDGTALPAWQEYFNEDGRDHIIPANLSPEVLKGLLRGELGFNGIIGTDSACYSEYMPLMKLEWTEPYSIEAGCDVILTEEEQRKSVCTLLLEGFEKGTLSEKRLDEAVIRVLAWKISEGSDLEEGKTDPESGSEENTAENPSLEWA